MAPSALFEKRERSDDSLSTRAPSHCSDSSSIRSQVTLTAQSLRNNESGTSTPDTIDIEKCHDEQAPVEEPYSDWFTWERRFIVFCAAAAAFFSPFSANIYFPLFNTLTRVLNVTDTEINLSVTTYMIFQGVTPMFVAAFSDGWGRRPAYIICFILYLAANIGLALQTDYAALLVLRCLQSAGSASTVALGKAVVADIATTDRRGLYSSLTSVGVFLGPAFGPTIGGLLAYYLGWRSVFWFLVISAGIFFIALLLWFPETCRSVVGNGNRRPATWNMSITTMLHLRRKGIKATDSPKSLDSASTPKKKKPNFLATIRIAFEKEMSIITVTSGLCFSAFYAITSSVPSIFTERYGYNTIEVGLCFIAVGAGSLVAAIMQGKLIDWNFKRHALRLGFPLEKGKILDLTDFPLEVARLEIAIPLVALLCVSTAAFGWVVHFDTHVAAPLTLLFFAGFSSSAAYSVITVLIIDIHPESPASATAGNNLVRCLLSAGATAAIIPMSTAMGRGWAFTLVAALCAAATPLLLLCMKKGQKWRSEMQQAK